MTYITGLLIIEDLYYWPIETLETFEVKVKLVEYCHFEHLQ